MLTASSLILGARTIIAEFVNQQHTVTFKLTSTIILLYNTEFKWTIYSWLWNFVHYLFLSVVHEYVQQLKASL